jgi:hypothetical protein
MHFTNDINDFSYYEPMKTKQIVQTAAKDKSLQIAGMGVVTVDYFIDKDGKRVRKTKLIKPVFYMPEMDTRLLSLGVFLLEGYSVNSRYNNIIITKGSSELIFRPHPRAPPTIFWFTCTIRHDQVHGVIKTPDYYIWHKRLGHPGDDPLRNAGKTLEGFPVSLEIPKTKTHTCEGCAKGKMPNQSYPRSDSRALNAFGLIHSDLMTVSILSYHKYKYIQTFLDDHTGHVWIALLCKKSDSIHASKQFIAMVETQFETTPKKWHIDGGGEFMELQRELISLGIIVEMSLPYQHQQNGRAERINRTIWEKAQSL